MIVFAASFAGFPAAYGQYDSLYVKSYRGYVMPKIVLSRKTTGLNYHNSDKGYSLRYQPNKTFNIGVGVTYKFVSFKIGVGAFQPHERRGDTRDLDFQFHRYGKKFVADFLLQFYKGFFLPDRRFGTPTSEFYTRPDLAVSALGGSMQYIFNHRRFSYRAAFQQTEWQKRSVGTWLTGFELFMGRFRADSTIVPAALAHAQGEDVNKMRFIEFGPNVGYAYTWVYKRMFVTTSGSVGVNVGLNRFYRNDKGITFTGLSPNNAIKISMGYSKNRWGINLLLISTALRVPEFENSTVVVNTGTIRMNIIYRIYPKGKMKQLLKPIDEMDDRL